MDFRYSLYVFYDSDKVKSIIINVALPIVIVKIMFLNA